MIVLLFTDHTAIAFVLFLVACFGDILDGQIARLRGEVTASGKVLDPAVDKALYISVLVSLFALDKISLTTMILFLIPHISLLVGGLVLHFRAQAIQEARIAGKFAAVVTFVATSLMILDLPSYGLPILHVAIALTFFACVDYFLTARRTVQFRRRDTTENT